MGLGRADVWSNQEFRHFREGFDIVLTDTEQDLYSLIGVSVSSKFLNHEPPLTRYLLVYALTNLVQSSRIHHDTL